MVEDSRIIKVTNRDNGSVGYSVPDLGVKRLFQSGETKDITFEELRKLSYIPGGMFTIRELLMIDDNEVVEELLGEVEPEYFYSVEDIKTLLEEGSVEQLQDALDFAPEGVCELIKEWAVKLEINDIRKRKAIKDKLGFDVTAAIEINAADAEEDANSEQRTRRTTPLTSAKTENPTAPERRVSSKYKVIEK